jgi:hypothetical protein
MRRSGATAAVIAFIAATLWGSGTLSLETNPTGAEIWYAHPGESDWKYLGDSPLEKREIPPGRYDIWILVDSGRDTLSMPDVVISEGQHTHISRELPTRYASFHLKTQPDSALVFMDGVELGRSPYENSMVLPGQYELRLVSDFPQYRTHRQKLIFEKGDSLSMKKLLGYRNHAFLEEHLSLLPWQIQIDGGFQYLSNFGVADETGKRRRFSTDKKRTQYDFPVAFRLDLPFGFEPHLLLPFKSFSNEGASPGQTLPAPVPRDLTAGLKFTIRSLGVGINGSYSVGADTSEGGYNRDRFILTVLGMASKEKYVGSVNVGIAFHFSDKDSAEYDYGDQPFANVRIGYSAGNWLPYAEAKVVVILSDNNGTEDLNNSGYATALELGALMDLDDTMSLQFGIPFSVFNSNANLIWGMHASLSMRFAFM